MNDLKFLRKIILLLIIPSFGFKGGQDIWQKAATETIDSEIRCLELNPSQDAAMWVGTARGLYQLFLGNDPREMVISQRKLNHPTNGVYIEEGTPPIIWAATDSGIYQSSDAGLTWRRVFEPPGEGSRSLSMTSLRGTKYAGTTDGLFLQRPGQSHWERHTSLLGHVAVPFLIQDEEVLLAVTDRNVYRLDPATDQLTQIYTTGIGKTIEHSDESIDPATSAFISPVRDIDVVRRNPARIYLTTTEGIFFSDDQGESWDELGIIGLPLKEVRSLIVWTDKNGEHDEFLVGTSQGVFYYDDTRWVPLYRGLDTNMVFKLIQSKSGFICAATDRGFFGLSPAAGERLTETAPLPFKDDNEMQEFFNHEPSVQAVQEMAVHYADVSNDKIKRWRSLARTRAFIPNISAGLDRSSTERLHWDTGSNPDNLLNGKDVLDWDLRLTWSLADVLWSDDQTAIDNRSKLMVELRDEILDQVTRLYFERRRLQVEMLKLVQENFTAGLDQKLRIDELTALIDSFTGGKFSREIEKIKRDYSD